ncbi:MAG: endonuclease/exonuclease/phosphatase family protein [Pseudomonadota bacterium]
MRRFFSVIVTILIVAFIVLVLLVLGIYKSGYHPIGETNLDVEQGSWAGEDPPQSTGKGLKILFLNLNHGLGRDLIWYERNPPAEVAHEDQAISHRLDQVVALVRDQAADALVLQEVDFGSRATGERDQAEILARRLGWAYVARARTQMSPYPLYPRPLVLNFSGGIDSGVAVLSRYPIAKSVLYPLPGSRDRGWMDDAFGPIAVVHEARIRVGDEKELKILQVVLDQVDSRARERQASAAAEWIETRDFHDAVVYATTWTEPAQRPKNPEEAKQMGEMEYTMDLLRHKGSLKEVVQDRDFFQDPAAHATWLGAEGAAPIRRFDYLLTGGSINTSTPKLLEPMPDLSDHVPLLLGLDLP